MLLTENPNQIGKLVWVFFVVVFLGVCVCMFCRGVLNVGLIHFYFLLLTCINEGVNMN